MLESKIKALPEQNARLKRVALPIDTRDRQKYHTQEEDTAEDNAGNNIKDAEHQGQENKKEGPQEPKERPSYAAVSKRNVLPDGAEIHVENGRIHAVE